MTDPTHEQPAEPADPAAEPASSAGPADLPQPAVPAENGTPAFEAAETPEVPERTRFAEPVTEPVTEPVAADPAEPTISAGPTAAPEPPAPAEIAPPVPAREEPAQPETARMEPAPVGPPAVPSPVAAELEPEPEPAASTDTARSGRRLVTALAVVVALLAGLTGFLGYEVSATSGPGPDQRARQPALQAVRSAAVLLFSYDYRHLQADFKAGRAVTTGKFRGEYDKTTSKLVNDVAPRYKAVVVAAVSEAAVVSAAQDRVVALVFVNQQSSSTLTEAPKVTQSRLLMTVVRRNGTWLVSDISPR